MKMNGGVIAGKPRSTWQAWVILAILVLCVNEGPVCRDRRALQDHQPAGSHNPRRTRHQGERIRHRRTAPCRHIEQFQCSGQGAQRANGHHRLSTAGHRGSRRLVGWSSPNRRARPSSRLKRRACVQEARPSTLNKLVKRVMWVPIPGSARAS